MLLIIKFSMNKSSCVPEMDKAASMGLSTFILSVFSFVPSPIFYGYIMDQSCLVWGRTCLGSGYCWLYDRDSLRFVCCWFL